MIPIIDQDHLIPRRVVLSPLRMRFLVGTGESDSDILPHPDDIHIDFNAGTAELCGPMDKDEKKEWDGIREIKAECDRRIAEYKALLAKSPDDPELKRLLKSQRSVRAKAEAFLTRKRRLI